MKKIPTLYLREEVSRKRALATREVNPECAFVLEGGCTPTIKWDGTACLVHDGRLYKRHALKLGKPRPEGWVHHDFDPAAESGHGWVPVGDGPDDRWHREAWALAIGRLYFGTTYELIGPKVQGNPYKLAAHQLVRHGAFEMLMRETDYDLLQRWLSDNAHEGIVWWRDGVPVAKIKRRDFGLPWPVAEAVAR